MAKKQTLKLFNTLTRKKEVFEPVEPGKVKMYVCGPTVYDFIHIGNARPFIVFDVVRRYFEFLGYDVTYVQNITDIDDKIIKKANEEGITAGAVAAKYITEYIEDRRSLGVKDPDHEPKATEYIDEMMRLIQDLEKKDIAYNAEGNVFFEAGKYAEYGRLSGKDLSKMEVGERVTDDIQRQKRDPVRDFALWKAAKPGEPAWESPWGQGRPGWHTECVVMSTGILGDAFDIHGGGIDLVFPHHENEIAQAACTRNAAFARYWMHNEFLNIREEKMAKSVGNVVTVRDLTGSHSTEAIRLFYLQTHYRKSISFDSELLAGAETAVGKLSRVLQKIDHELDAFADDPALKNIGDEPADEFVDSVRRGISAAMNDDFNTAKAVGEVFNLVNHLDKVMAQPAGHATNLIKYWQGRELLRSVDTFFGIIPGGDSAGSADDERVESLIDARNRARKERSWEEADSIRDELLEMGIQLEDTKEGTRWHRMR